MTPLTWLLRVAVAAVFAYAAVTKIGDPAGFFAAVRTFHALPDPVAAGVALWLPWAELVGGLAIFWPRHRRAALWALAAMTVVFLGALGQAWLRGLDINCGCFGEAAKVRDAGYIRLFARDLALLGVIAWLLWREAEPASALSAAEFQIAASESAESTASFAKTPDAGQRRKYLD